jgi:pyrroloquinoline quinone (PQQ) biosynthesis protein C
MQMDTESLLEELTRETRTMNIGANPFLTALADGTCSRDAIRRYAVETYVLSSTFPQRLGSLVAMCSDSAVRLELVRNILEEEGVTSFDGEHIVRRDDRQHGEIARRFAHAAGAGDEELLRARQETRREIWLDRAIADGRLCSALAYLTVGFEGCVPPTYALLIDALEKNYAFSRDDLEFFILHMTADADHSRIGAEMTAALVRTEADREEAVTGVKRARTAWWWWHRSFAR